MSIVEVKVPQLSESVAEATMLTWHKKVGDAVARDENLIDIETDKVVLELPAPAAGVLIKIIKGDGTTVVADEIIAVIDTDGVAAAAAPAASSTSAAAPAAAPAPGAGPAAAVPDAPVAALDIVRALIAQKLKKPFSEIPLSKAIKDLVGGE